MSGKSSFYDSRIDSDVLRYYSSAVALSVPNPNEKEEEEMFVGGWGGVRGLQAPVCVLKPNKMGKMFVLVPADGFHKQPNQPLYAGEPVQLLELESKRFLSKLTRFPFEGHVGLSNRPIVFTLTHQQKTSNGGSNRQHQRTNRSSSLLEICSGDLLVFDGLRVQYSKQFEEGCLMYTKKNIENSSSGSCANANKSVNLCCKLICLPLVKVPMEIFQFKAENVSEGINSHSGTDEKSSRISDGSVTESSDSYPSSGTEFVCSLSTTSSKRAKSSDQTLTGEFIGYLHSGYLYKQMNFTKSWKIRFFVLTHVALHRYELSKQEQEKLTYNSVSSLSDQEQISSWLVRNANRKSRGDILVADMKAIHYDSFSTPRNFKIEMRRGNSKFIYLRSFRDAVEAGYWASILTKSLENPEWIHCENGASQTIWRSDKYFTSGKCPTIRQISVVETHSDSSKSKTVATNPVLWGKSVSLGEITFAHRVEIEWEYDSACYDGDGEGTDNEVVQDKRILKTCISLESLNEAVLNAVWVNVDCAQESLDSQFSTRLKIRSKVQVFYPTSSPPVSPLAGENFGDKIINNSKCRKRAALIFFGIAIAVLVITYFNNQWRSWILGCFGIIMFVFLSKKKHQDSVCIIEKENQESFHQITRVRWFLKVEAVEIRPLSTSKDSTFQNRQSRIDSDDGDDDDDDDFKVKEAIKNDAKEKLNPNLKSPPYWNEMLKKEEDRIMNAQRWQNTYQFRLENGLDSILELPFPSFFVIKKFLPSIFWEPDRLGRRVFLISLNDINFDALTNHFISNFNLLRYFLFLWEYICNCKEEAASMEVVLLVDCSNIGLTNAYGCGLHLVRDLIAITNKHYPSCISKVCLLNMGGSVIKTIWSLLRRSLDFDTRLLCEEYDTSRTPAALADLMPKKNIPEAFGGSLKGQSSGEIKLIEFVSSKLSQQAQAIVEPFSMKEVTQAANLAKFGHIYSPLSKDELKVSANISNDPALLLIPSSTFTWNAVLAKPNFELFVSVVPTETSLAQWRGTYDLKSSYSSSPLDARFVAALIHDPMQRSQWDDCIIDYHLLSSLQNCEDIAFWSRTVGPMADARGQTVRSCALRRVYRELPNNEFEIMWKTTSCTPNTFNTLYKQYKKRHGEGLDCNEIEKDPIVMMCFHIQQIDTGGCKISFWYESIVDDLENKKLFKQVGEWILSRFELMEKYIHDMNQ